MSGALRTAFSVLGACAIALLGARARAQPAAPAPAPASHPAAVRLVAPTCATPPVDVVGFITLLRIELATDGVASVEVGTAAGQLPLAVIALEVMPCSPDAREVVVTIDDAATRKSVRRAIHLGDVVPSGRARALALAVAELLRASWAELAMPEAPPPSAPVPAAVRQGALERAARASGSDASAARPPAPMRAPWLVSAEIEGRAFMASESALAGGRLAASLPLVSALRLRLGAGMLYGTATDALGDVDLRLFSGRVGVSLCSESASVAAELGPRLELGWGGAEGRPFDLGTRGQSGTAFVSTLSLAALLRVRLVDRWWAVVEPEVGGVLRGFRARADERAAGGLTGAMVGVSLGIAAGL